MSEEQQPYQSDSDTELFYGLFFGLLASILPAWIIGALSHSIGVGISVVVTFMVAGIFFAHFLLNRYKG